MNKIVLIDISKKKKLIKIKMDYFWWLFVFSLIILLATILHKQNDVFFLVKKLSFLELYVFSNKVFYVSTINLKKWTNDKTSEIITWRKISSFKAKKVLSESQKTRDKK